MKSLLAALGLAVAQVASAATVTLAWNASLDPGVNNYNIYSGGLSRQYTNMVHCGNVTQQQVGGLIEGRTYFFAATASTASGLESAYSSEISYLVPTGGPVITQQPSSSTNDFGSSITLSVLATGSTLTYQWTKGGTFISGAITPSITITNASWVNNGVYACVVSNPGGSVTSANATVSVRPPAPTNFRAVGP